MGRYNLDSGIIDDKSDKSSNARQQQNEQQRAVGQERAMAAAADAADPDVVAGTSGSFEISTEVLSFFNFGR